MELDKISLVILLVCNIGVIVCSAFSIRLINKSIKCSERITELLKEKEEIRKELEQLKKL